MQQPPVKLRLTALRALFMRRAKKLKKKEEEVRAHGDRRQYERGGERRGDLPGEMETRQFLCAVHSHVKDKGDPYVNIEGECGESSCRICFDHPKQGKIHADIGKKWLDFRDTAAEAPQLPSAASA